MIKHKWNQDEINSMEIIWMKRLGMFIDGFLTIIFKSKFKIFK
jgi:hypothetical protein